MPSVGEHKRSGVPLLALSGEIGDWSSDVLAIVATC